MTYRTIEKNRKVVESIDGRNIPINYLKHPRFSYDCDLCLGLHYTFIRFVPGRSYSKGYGVRKAINLFLDFVAEHESKSPSKLHLSSLEDVTAEIYFTYNRFCKKCKAPVEVPVRLKSALINVASEYDEGMPILTLPILDQTNDTPREPLTDEAFKQLSEALKTHIDTLYEKIDFRIQVENAKPYSYSEAESEVESERASVFNRRNIFRWIQYFLYSHSNNLHSIWPKTVRTRLSACFNDEELLKIAGIEKNNEMVEALLAFYNKESAPHLLEEPKDPLKSRSMSDFSFNVSWKPSSERALKTLLVHNHPFSVSYENFIKLYKTKSDGYSNGNVLSLIYKWYTSPEVKADVKLQKLLELYFPSNLDQAAIVLFIQLQTGWNKEIVLAIDEENYEHVLTGALNVSQALIVSEKNKSQGHGKPFLKPKSFLSPSDKRDKYSTYNLISLANSLVEPFSNLPHDCETERTVLNSNPLFMCMRGYKVLTKGTNNNGGRSGRYLSITNTNQWMSGVKKFFQKYEVLENGKRITHAKDINGRLRPTWIKHVRDRKDRPLSVVALVQGHSSIETTDVHYDSSGMAMQKRRERLRSELEAVTRLLRARKFKGLIGKSDNSSIDIASFRIFTIPNHDRSLWACMDSYKADWPGSAGQVQADRKCSAISKCLFCSQVCILEDSLPFLMEREISINAQLETHTEVSFNSPLSDELQIIQYILDEWGDESALKSAARYQRKHKNLIPTDMQLLSFLFEDEA